MSRPRLLDLFCGAGGTAMGYHRAGFEVVGVDIESQSRYPFEFIQGDALSFPLKDFAAIHASPPCQFTTKAQRIQKRDHPDFIGPIRERLLASGLPYVIENVPGAPLRHPLELCGCMFTPLGTYRPRWFEASFQLPIQLHQPHLQRQTKMGRPSPKGELIQVVGHFSDVRKARLAMGIEWMTRDELKEAVPPAYTEWISQQLLAHLTASRAA